MGANGQAVEEEAGKALASNARWRQAQNAKKQNEAGAHTSPQDPRPDYQWHDQISPSPATSIQDLGDNLGLEAYSGKWLFQC